MLYQKTTWTVQELKDLYRLKHDEKRGWKEILSSIKTKSVAAMKRKYGRTNWSIFLDDPLGYINGSPNRKWTHEEMIQLEAFIQSGCSHQFIADKLGRSIISVERQVQDTDWSARKEIRDLSAKNAISSESEKVLFLEKAINSLLNTCRNDFSRLNVIKEKEFLERVKIDKSRLICPFSEIVEGAKKNLIAIGYGNPSSINMEDGTYIIIGDSHGKHTKKNMFALLDKVNSFIKPTKIIHIGHILDDDNDISYEWGRFDNLIILANANELRAIQEQRNKYRFRYEVVRKEIIIGGDLVITNQDLISDHAHTSIGNLDNQIMNGKAIVNCHRLEFSTRCCDRGASYFASPGCLCENHIPRTIKQIDFDDGHQVKQTCPEGYIKYRRMSMTNKYWERGMLVVQVDKNGSHTIIPCPIKETCKGFTTSYFNKIITSQGVFNPDKKIFINGDMHCDKHDISVLDIQEKICKDYRPDVHVNLGDTFNYAALNHHIMDRGGVIIDKQILSEAAQTHFVLRRVRKWAKESYLIYGNHERFPKDFEEKFPQFGGYLDFKFICALEDLGYKLIDLKKVLKIGSAKFIHGEMKMYGQPGSKMEKAARTFGKDVFIGHIHRPEIRFGCHSIGLSGILDQDYNEPDASNWVHGFGLCNQFMGKNWPTTIAIVDNKCLINGKTYESSDPSSWKVDKYSVKIVYASE